MIRIMCVAGAMSLLVVVSVGAQSGVSADSTTSRLQRAPVPLLPVCRAGAYPEIDSGPGPLYVVGDLLVGGDSTVPGYTAKMPVYVKGGDVDRLDVIKGPEAVALYGCRARQGAIRIELKPEVKLRPEWRAATKAPAATPPPATPQPQQP